MTSGMKSPRTCRNNNNDGDDARTEQDENKKTTAVGVDDMDTGTDTP